MTARDVWEIVKDQRPVVLAASATVAEACRHMRDRRVGSVLVSDPEGRLAGIFTGRDAVCRVLAPGRSATRTRLDQVMTAAPATLGRGHSAVEALRLMRDGGFRHVPVVDDGRIVGVLSHGDAQGLELAQLDEETGLWERL